MSAELSQEQKVLVMGLPGGEIATEVFRCTASLECGHEFLSHSDVSRDDILYCRRCDTFNGVESVFAYEEFQCGHLKTQENTYIRSSSRYPGKKIYRCKICTCASQARSRAKAGK